VAERRPVRSDADADVLVDEVVEALADNAWPKVGYAGGEYPPMLFEIFRRDEQLEVAAKIRSNYSRYYRSLTEIRKTLKQLEGPTEESSDFQVLKSSPPIPINLRPARTFDAPHSAFFGERSDSTSGYLHLCSRWTAARVPSAEKMSQLELLHAISCALCDRRQSS